MAQNALEHQLLEATRIMEQQVDAEIEKLDRMDDDDFDKLRERRLEAMRQAQKQKQELLAKGHGKYYEIATEKDFFDECKRSKKVVCHFYRDSTFRCKIVDKHLEILAPKHVETKFIKINAEKCPFLVERLRIVVMPTICVAMDGKTTDYIVGFDDLGGVDDFPTEMLEWRLGRAQAISYQGDLLNPPEIGEKKGGILGFSKTKKTIKGRDDDASSDEDDW
ncbi:thioredoxin domain-containing protein 9-like [Saccostrea cucullata]|uniref:thioredoxin domain-containing protein 9-like n=1 Tax=Saccostrea cuccullata TaxID=36930 RepID=UPI002ED3CC94